MVVWRLWKPRFLANSSVSRGAHQVFDVFPKCIFYGSLAIPIGFIHNRCLGVNFVLN